MHATVRNERIELFANQCLLSVYLCSLRCLPVCDNSQHCRHWRYARASTLRKLSFFLDSFRRTLFVERLRPCLIFSRSIRQCIGDRFGKCDVHRRERSDRILSSRWVFSVRSAQESASNNVSRSCSALRDRRSCLFSFE